VRTVVQANLTMELQVWPGDWGLPSVDQHCLAAMVYCKFFKLPVTITKVSNPWKSPTGQFPILRHSDSVESNVADIFGYLKEINESIDEELSDIQSSDSLAFSALIEEKLLPAVLYLLWVDLRSYEDFTRPYYGSIVPFPFGLWMMLRKRNACIERLQACYGDEGKLENQRDSKIMRDAKECLNLLSAKLGEKNYFFGSKPSSLDALVFGYIAPLLRAPLPNTTLPNHLKGCRNLTQFCTRILDEHFPLTTAEKELLKKREEEARQKMLEVSEYPHKKRNLVIAGIVVVAAMVGYAFMSGLVQIDFVDVEKNKEEASRGTSSSEGSSTD